MSHGRTVDKNSLLSTLSGSFLAHAFPYMVKVVNSATAPPARLSMGNGASLRESAEHAELFNGVQRHGSHP